MSFKSLPLPITSERLIIRNLTADDAAGYFYIFGNPTICRYDDFEPITFEEAVEEVSQPSSVLYSPVEEIQLAVEQKDSKQMIGILYTQFSDGVFYIGYHFNESFHGKGYATEVLKAYLPVLALQETTVIKALVHPHNTASKRVLEKLGFHFEKLRKVFGTDQDEEIYRL